MFHLLPKFYFSHVKRASNHLKLMARRMGSCPHAGMLTIAIGISLRMFDIRADNMNHNRPLARNQHIFLFLLSCPLEYDETRQFSAAPALLSGTSDRGRNKACVLEFGRSIHHESILPPWESVTIHTSHASFERSGFIVPVMLLVGGVLLLIGFRSCSINQAAEEFAME
ncbi:hypothetical protein BDR06DRAFT_564479 [Suillus hirtellus]|nr:hypothetical protein BDR06DRAFT_564479 [Suillus hirtellus]